MRMAEAPATNILPQSFQWGEPFAAFKTTRWTAVRAAGSGEGETAATALEELCRAYWFPLYAFVRRHGHSPEDAQDLTQDFFARFLGKNYFARADQERGKFRTFLLASLKHFLQEDWRRGARLKRGGGERPISLDAAEAESRLAAEPGFEAAPDRCFDRCWAEALLQRVHSRLQQDYARTGREAVFQNLQRLLWGQEPEHSYAAMGARLNMNEGAVKVAALRLRRRFRDLLREEVRACVATAADVDDELRHLLSVLQPE